MFRRPFPVANRGMATSAINEIITITMRISTSVKPRRGAMLVRRAGDRTCEARIGIASTGPNVRTATEQRRPPRRTESSGACCGSCNYRRGRPTRDRRNSGTACAPAISQGRIDTTSRVRSAVRCACRAMCATAPEARTMRHDGLPQPWITVEAPEPRATRRTHCPPPRAWPSNCCRLTKHSRIVLDPVPGLTGSPTRRGIPAPGEPRNATRRWTFPLGDQGHRGSAHPSDVRFTD